MKKTNVENFEEIEFKLFSDLVLLTIITVNPRIIPRGLICIRKFLHGGDSRVLAYW